MRVKVDQELIDTIARLEVDSLIEGLNDEALRTNPQFLAKVRQFLKENDFKVDYIISHTGGETVTSWFGFNISESDSILERVLSTTDYKKHFCGHLHYDTTIENHRVLYDDIIEI